MASVALTGQLDQTGYGRGGTYTYLAPDPGEVYQADNQFKIAGLADKQRTADRAFKQSIFDKMFPMAQQGMGMAGQMMQGFPGFVGGFGSGIQATPMYRPQDIQREMNAQTAQNDSRFAGEARRFSEQLAGRGIGRGSPVAQSMMSQMAARNAGANSDSRRQTMLDMSRDNSQYLLGAQRARDASMQNWFQAQTQRMGLPIQLLSALGGFVG